MKSKFFKLNFQDFLKGSIVAVLSAVGTVLTTEQPTLKSIGLASLVAFLAYLAKNLFTNSDDKILKSE